MSDTYLYSKHLAHTEHSINIYQKIECFLCDFKCLGLKG